MGQGGTLGEGKGEGIAAVWRKHDGAAGVARSASHAHCLGVDNDFGVTLASLWRVLAINANMVRPRLSNGRALTSARQLKANQRPSGGWDSAGVRAGERWISHLPPVCAEQALGQRPLRRTQKAGDDDQPALCLATLAGPLAPWPLARCKSAPSRVHAIFFASCLDTGKTCWAEGRRRAAAGSGTKLMLHYCAPLTSAGLPSLLC
jgi:hypothetical protein